ncbi:nitroreductase family protein (plasmid) [Pseudorhodobacter turbinis]|uniref:Nitroreductase family protein n=1 Tax=Pseudorhodobacter turbinis TaxID=2500533 RepID=A0A4P8ELF8_9RHOB|nr:nitroreductase family protein [Pseudorhodobacter turbinis]
MASQTVKTGFTLGHNYVNDLTRFLRWSHKGRQDRHAAQTEYAILKQYHGIEKGLSLKEPRPGFGQEKIKDLLVRIDTYEKDPAHKPAVVKAAIGSLLDYRTFNRTHDVSQLWLDRWLEARSSQQIEHAERDGGVEHVTRAAILEKTAGVTENFFMSRHSIRNFSGGEVPFDDIERAANIARKTPSVCNRQGPRSHCFMNASKALKLQSGNAGFGHQASRALVITSDIQAYSSVGERHQAYIDGGLYAMSIVYALHALGYGSCMLAWNQTMQKNAKARTKLGIPDNEVIIMMIAVGTLPDELVVANAYRRPVSSSLFVHPDE